MDTNYNVTSNQPYSSTDSSSGSSGASGGNLMQMLEQLIQELQQMLQSSSSSGSGDSGGSDSGGSTGGGGTGGGGTGMGSTGGATGGGGAGGATGGMGGAGGMGGVGGVGGGEGGGQQGGLHNVKLEMAGKSGGKDMLEGAPNADGSSDLYNKDGKHEGVVEKDGSIKFDNAQAADDVMGVKKNSMQGMMNQMVADKEGGTPTTKPGAMTLTAGDLPGASS